MTILQKNKNVDPVALKSGFTLIEVLVAIVFITIGLLATLTVHSRTQAGNSFSDNLGYATFLAESTLEEYTAMTPSMLSGKPATESAKYTRYGLKDATGPISGGTGSQQFNRVVNVVPKYPWANTYQVGVVISWTDTFGDHSISYVTVVANGSFVGA